MASKQITVRLPEELVSYLDDHVGEGRTKSRASFLTTILARAQREERDNRDIAIYQSLSDADRVEDQALGEFGRSTAAKVWTDLD